MPKKGITLIDAPHGGQGKRYPPLGSRPLFGKNTLASPNELSNFLESIERRAFKQAMFAVHEEEAALDIVQDSMLKLAEKYGDRPAEEFPMLFQRILQNTIRDFYRRSKVRSMWTTLLSAFSSDDDEDHDPLETLAADEDDAGPRTPESKLLQSQTLNLIEDEIKKLPARQREAFLMRYWEDMDVAETAAAMGCSEGSVKTHCSRATHALAAALSAKGIKL
ncbi:RNA polymerase sigma factor [Dechloromonas sp. ZS-1]|uniref:RNA polymerase sigma factor n=1 Tax=Dechloromonas sp. ZS-1 TaxID=3138067 RepID=UPI0031FBA721